MITDEDVATSKLEDIIRDQGRRLQIRCIGKDPDGRYALEAWIGNRKHPSGQPRRGVLEKSQLDETSSSGPLKPQVDAILGRFFHALSAVPDDPRDRERFPVFVDRISGRALAGQIRSIVAAAPVGLTAKAVTDEIVALTHSRSQRREVEERVRNILDHLTLRSHQRLDYRDGRYRAR